MKSFRHISMHRLRSQGSSGENPNEGSLIYHSSRAPGPALLAPARRHYFSMFSWNTRPASVLWRVPAVAKPADQTFVPLMDRWAWTKVLKDSQGSRVFLFCRLLAFVNSKATKTP